MSDAVGFELSRQQRAVWKVFGGDSTVSLVSRLERADADSVQAALESAVASHEALRTTLSPTAGLALPLQHVHESLRFVWHQADSTASSMLDVQRGQIDSSHGPVLAAGIATGGLDRHLVLTAAAAIADVSTLQLLADAANGVPAAVGDPIQYAEYSAWQQERTAAETVNAEDEGHARDAWLRLVPEQVEPTRLPQVASADAASGPHRGDPLTLLAPASGFAAPAAWLAAWSLTIARLTGDQAVTLAVNIDPRTDPELAGAAGPYSRLVPLTVPVPVEGTFADYADRLARSLEQVAVWLEWAPETPPGGLVFGVGPFAATESRGPIQLELRVTPDGSRARVIAGPEGSTELALLAATALGRLLETSAGDIVDCDVLDESAVTRLVGGAPRPASSASFVALMLQSAAKHPDRIAITDGTRALSYRELISRVDALAGALVAAGADEAPVAIYLPRSMDFLVAMLAAQRAGSGYLPLDIEQPTVRSQQQVQVSGAHILVSGDGVKTLDDFGGSTVAVDSEVSVSLPKPSADHLAYVIFTSGSTGAPKGVAIPASALGNYIDGLVDLVGARDGEPRSWALVTSPTTDLGNTAIFPALASGGTVHVVDTATVRDPAEFGRYIAAHHIDILKITPSHLGALLADRTADVLPAQVLIIGGEALPSELVAEIAERGRCRVVNHYGPTETTIGALVNPLDTSFTPASETGTVPIGRPLPGVEAIVVDGRRRIAPVGAVGELAIGGAGLARGYVNDAQATSERFVSHPYRAGERLYLTGDLARRQANGTIDFLGRRDGQVKLRGYRIERGEIEPALRSHPSVRRAAVVLRTDTSTGPQLVGYVVCQVNLSPSESELREHVARLLPEYMVPVRIVALDSLPLKANGKLDEAALPEPPEIGSGEHEDPAGVTEQRIAVIFSEVLGVPDVGATDDFFALGGHSLLATRIVVEVRSALGVQLPVYSLFEAPSVRGLAVLVEAAAVSGADVSDDELAAMIAELDGLSDEQAAALLAAENDDTDLRREAQ